MGFVIAISILLGVAFILSIILQITKDNGEEGIYIGRILLFLVTIVMVVALVMELYTIRDKNRDEKSPQVEYEEKIIYSKTPDGEFLPDTIYLKK
jgi:uncharacterized membrane protein